MKKYRKLLVFVFLVLALPVGALSQGIDEGEFSQAMLGHKLHQLRSRYEQAEADLLTRTGAHSKLKGLKLEDVDRRIISLETEFQRGGYYPDLLDEQIVIVREDLQLILADPGHTGIDPKTGLMPGVALPL